MAENIILGIDPGSVCLGYGVIDAANKTLRQVAYGTVKVKGDSLPVKLGVIYRAIEDIISTYKPAEVAVEQVFVAKNAQSALKLGQARGAAVCAAVNQGLPVSEYAARLVKQSATGTGGADKQQVQKMMQILFCLDGVPPEDAADGLAIAVCHANHSSMPATKLPGVDLTSRRSRPRRRSR